MILRTVFVKLNSEWGSDEARETVMRESHAVLRALPGVQRVSVGPAADPTSLAAWDFTMQVQFANLEDVEVYRVHPDHLAYLSDYLSPKADAKKVWNFELPDSAG